MSGGSVYTTCAVIYSILPTGTGLRNVEGSRDTNVGRACANAAAVVNASSNVCFRRKPPKIMKWCRLRYCGCMIVAVWRRVVSMKWRLSGLRNSS